MKDAFSLRFLFLRSSTAATSVVTGLLQTFVFARVLTPEQFSLFVLVGALGFTLLLCDLGASKILFVRLRQHHLDKSQDDSVVSQTSAILVLYLALAFLGALVCFAAMVWSRPESLLQSLQFTLFFVFTALNLAWFSLRNITIAVDEYVYFETLEVIRRFGVIFATVALLLFLPLTSFLILINAAWVVVFALCILRLKARGALNSRLRGQARYLAEFWRQNGRMLLRSSIFSVSEIYIYNFPYFFVPAFYGLGAPTIILDTAFKVFRGGSVAYSAACDIAVPRQTQAYNDRDAAGLMRATWIALGLCSIPTVTVSIILFTIGDKLFAWLLGPAAVMPDVAPVLVLLLFANMFQMVALSLLVHTGYFKEIAQAAPVVVFAMTLGTLFAVFINASFLQYLWIYAIVYSCGAVIFVTLAWRGPIQTVRQGGGETAMKPAAQ
jgi:O-antigen/teichoic acid export membrane protein